MAHSLILGMTESGKTTFAKRSAAAYQARGIKTIVLDPLKDPAWNADFQTSNPEDFLDKVWSSRCCAVFIDEAGDSVGRFDAAMVKTATRGRHWGHNLHYISQRGTMLARTVRDQCSNLILFCTALEDCKIHAREWNNPQLLQGAALPQGSYMAVTRFGALKKYSLFVKEKTQ